MSGINSKSDKAAKAKKPLRKVNKLKSVDTILWRRFFFFALAVIVAVSIVCFIILGSSVTAQAKKRVRSVGAELLRTLNDGTLPQSAVEKKIADYSLIEGVDVFVFGADGEMLFGDARFPQEVVKAVYDSVSANVEEWQKDRIYEYGTRDNRQNTFNLVACVAYNGGECKLLVRYPIAAITAAVKQMELYMLIIALCAFVVAFFISYELAKKLSLPLKDISGTAKKLAEGDYSVQFNSAEYSEIAKLSDTLNYMKEEIKKTDDFQKELISNVSHDLKTPLTMIKAYASMIKEISGDDPEKREKHLQIIIDESDRLTGLVNDILNTSKISAGLDQLNLKVFNLTELLYGVINSFSYLQETQDYKLMVDVEPNLYTSADEEKIKQVIYNLISNAVNYTGDDKTVYITLKYSPEDDRIKFSVRDTGRGIPESDIAHIWDRYYRGSENHSRPVKGTGLGLNIVKIILKGHSFNFGVESKEGEGSLFYVDFPSASSEPVNM